MSFANNALGKRPPIQKQALLLKDVLSGVLPTIPVEANNLDGVPGWELGMNDRYGTCGPTSVANHRRLVTYNLTGRMDAVSLDDVFDLYRRSGNPNFDPANPYDDNGVYMHVMLDTLLRDGIGDRKPVAFAKIEPGDFDTLNAAVAIFGGVLLGLSLQVAQQRQSTWDFTSGSPEWGGHAVLAGRFADPGGDLADREGIITWAEELPTTRRFIEALEDEAWVVIWPEHLSDGVFLQGVDVNALRSAYEELTGRSFPAPDPEPVVPVPPSPAELLEAGLERLLRNKSVPRYFRDVAQLWLDTRE